MGKTALIVDDSKSARVVLKRMLETHALDVDTAESAEMALDYLSDHRPDVIFMDHMMPGMDGFEAVTAIKENPQTATIPIMMYTSQKGEVYVGQARALGAVGVLPKEVEPVEVSKVLASLHVIDGHGESGRQTGEDESSGEEAEQLRLASFDQNMRVLIEDLFDQQRAIIRRDLLDSYETIASRVADEMRSPVVDEPSDEKRGRWRELPGIYQAATAVLVLLVIVFGWLYWERERSWLTVQAQNESLLKAIEQQQSIEAQGTIEIQRRIDDYQQTLGSAYDTALRALEWGINQSATHDFHSVPLGDDRLPAFEALLSQLVELGFAGEVRIETHTGDFCMTGATADGFTLAAGDTTAAQCDQIGFGASEAIDLGRQQSVAFANFINISQRQLGGQIRFTVVSLGNTEPLMNNPIADSSLTAAQWNAMVAPNNRINVSLIPD